ncbi:MAG TPA: iron ABC transporter permease [Chloroflexi bacterium]|nr:iron ABC transporter permease [Chloroflexota bacterium]
MKFLRTPRNLFFILIFLLMCMIILSISLGSVRIPLEQVIRVIFGMPVEKSAYTVIILQYRIPKIITALLAGAALSVAGLQMQTLFQNPLADPFILGVSSGASLGVALIVLSVGTTGTFLLAGIGLLGDISIAAAAFLGSLLVLVFILMISQRARSSTMMLLIGLMVSYITSAVVSLLIYFSLPEKIYTYLSWTFGSFSGVTWSQIWIIVPALLLGFVVAFALSKPLNALLMGEKYAQTVGINIRRTRFWIIVSASLLAGIVTAFCGPIGFIGIAIPHVARAIFHSANHRILLPATFLIGSITAILSDVIAQLPGHQQVLPINVVTAMLGAPVVLWVLIKNQRNMQT